MSALHVLHIAPYSPETWAYGGIPRVVGSFTQGLARRGHTVTVCATDALSRGARLAEPGGHGGRVSPWPPRTTGGVTTRIFPNLSNRLAYDWQCFTPVGLGRFLRRHAASFDVAHLHACRNFPVTIAARHLRRAGVPFVLGPNGTAPRIERRQTAKRAWDLLVGDTPIRYAAAVLAVSRAERRQLLDLGLRDSEIHVIPNPVDLDEFAEPIDGRCFRERVGAGDAPLVLFLGKLTPRKRVDCLVDAFARVTHRSARLVIAGNDMGSLSEVRTAVRLHRLRDRTVFTGLLSGRERLEALTAADLVVYPSDHEVFGLVPVEALLCATLVAIAISVLLLVAVIELVRRRRLVEEYSIIWILGALVLLAASVWRGFLDTAAQFLGIYYPPSLVLMGLVLLFFVALLALSVVLSRQQRQIESLTEETAVLGAEIRDLRLPTGAESAPHIVPRTRRDRGQSAP